MRFSSLRRASLVLAVSMAALVAGCGGGEDTPPDFGGNAGSGGGSGSGGSGGVETDGAGPDAAEGGGACKSNADCAASTAGNTCDVGSGRCGQCSPTNDTCPTSKICDAASLTCVAGCKNDADCQTGGSSLSCDLVTHQCVGCSQDADCPLGSLCNAKHCVAGCNPAHGCQPGSECCSGSCADTLTDVLHCGSCTNACPQGPHASASCTGGSCATACDPGYGDCNINPADGCESPTSADPSNCGGCGNACSAANVVTVTCTAGVCDGACKGGYADCDSDKLANGCEVYLGDDANNCGGCGKVCSTTNVVSAACVGGACTGACVAGFADCDGNKQTNGCESSTSADAQNCGACGVACSGNHVPVPLCGNGSCLGGCEAGWADCDANKQANGCETNVGSDVTSCGGCGQACSSAGLTPVCTAGICTGPCNAGFADCNGDKKYDGCETWTAGSTTSCGACGALCSGNHVSIPACTNGTCTGTCSAGWSDCDGNKQTNGCEANTSTDPDNCGGCGIKCSPSGVSARACSNGVCVSTCAAGYGDCDGNKQTNGCEVAIGLDPSNCGGCGVVCSSANIPTTACSGGVCTGACAANFADCDGNKQTNGCEKSVATDVSSCGGCGSVCSTNHIASPVCTSGSCTGACDSGYTDCDGNKQTNGCEANLATDLGNCGSCGAVCSTNHVTASCTSGTCNGACAAGYTDCDGNKQTNGCEASTATDPDNCGGCGIKCSANGIGTRTCTAGVCTGACLAGYTDCDGNKQTNGCEVATGADPANCGACGKICSTANIVSATCTTGICSGACVAGFADCDGNKQTNGCEISVDANAANCGACGKTCSANHITSPTCGSGVCNGACDSGYTDCDGNKQTNGCEANLTTDLGNCGTCGVVCSSNHVTASCTSGTCNGACAAGYADCDGNKQTNGCEAATGTDPDNCGGCGIKCSANGVGTRTCTAGVCTGTCLAGYTDCDGNKQTNGCEVATGTDPSNCGGCGKICSGNNVTAVACAGGLCTGACTAGFADCDGNKQTNGCEINVDSNVSNCGGCGKTCSASNVSPVMCTSGVCNGPCSGGFLDCDGNKQTNGCEINPNTDPSNCGGCGTSCSANHMSTRTCGAGVCNGTCAAGYADCNANKLADGCEISTTADPANCGGCNVACSGNHVPTPTCTGSVCSGVCASGYADCNGNKQSDGCEISIASDVSNCGACARVCSSNNIASPVCAAGLCSGACNAGFSDCDANKQTDGCESNPLTDPSNCGACGISCSSNHMATRTCNGSTCDGTCAAGYSDCDGNKLSNGCETSTASDAANCGNCGNACPGGQTCANGTCQTCNTKVLVLATATDTGASSALSTVLTAAGLVPTVVSGGTASYANSPAANTFGSIIILLNTGYGTDMNVTGQSAIAAAVSSGATGLIFTDWSSYQYSNNATLWASLRPYVLLSYYTSTTGVQTWGTTNSSHPVWAGVPATFTAVNSIGYSYGDTLVNGGTTLGTCTTCASTGTGTGPAMAVKDSGVYRVVQFANTGVGTTAGTPWNNDTYAARLMTNAAKWVAHCN